MIYNLISEPQIFVVKAECGKYKSRDIRPSSCIPFLQIYTSINLKLSFSNVKEVVSNGWLTSIALKSFKLSS